MPDERWKPLIGTPSKSPIPPDILVPDPSPTRSAISEAESPTMLPPSPTRSFIHQRRQGQHVPRPPVWRVDEYNNGSSDGIVKNPVEWLLPLPGIESDPGQMMANVLTEAPLVVNMMNGSFPTNFTIPFGQLGREIDPLTGDPIDTSPTPSFAFPVGHGTNQQSGSLFSDVNWGGRPPVDSGFTQSPDPEQAESSHAFPSQETARSDLPFDHRGNVSPPSYPAGEAQPVDTENVPEPRIEDHPSWPLFSAPTEENRGIQLHTTITIPDQTIKLRVKMHTSKVSTEGDMKAKAYSRPSGAKLEQRTAVAGKVGDEPHPVGDESRLVGDDLRSPRDRQSEDGKKVPGQPSTTTTACKDHLTGATGSMYPTQSSVAVDRDVTPRRSKIGFGSLNKSIGRSFERSRLVPRWLKPESTAKENEFPKTSQAANEPPSLPPIQDRGPAFASSADLSTATSKGKSRIPSITPKPEPTPESGPFEKTEHGTPTGLDTIQSNANRLHAESPNASRDSDVTRWVHVRSTQMNSPATVEWIAGNVPPTAGSHQQWVRTSDSRGRPDLVLHLEIPLRGFNQYSLLPAPDPVPPPGTHLPARGNDNADRSSVDDVPSLTTDETSSGESEIPAPPPATQPMVARPNVIAGEMTEGRAAPAA